MKQLNEINVLRPIIIILLVLYHSFIIYTGGWPKVKGIDDFAVYYWIAKLSYSCMLETFTFVSGYLLAHAINNGKKYTFRSLVTKKFKRLIFPSIVFTIIYSFFFYDKSYVSSGYIYDIFNGLGHMWYLPMLFWCFLAAYIILNIKIKESYKLILLLLLAVFSFISLPFRMQSTCYYLFFFYLGIFIYNNMFKKEIKNKYLFIGGSVALLLFISFSLIQIKLHEINAIGIFCKAVRFSLINVCKIIYSTAGLFFLYFLSIKVSSKYVLPNIILEINKLCFGVYLIQQFILEYIYYSTNLPIVFGVYILPWIAFTITLVCSLIISKLLMKNRLGRNLIG